MDPIKVDFSDNGKKKNVKDVFIPPDKPVLRILVNIAITAVVAVVAYYFMLPPMNLGSYDFYIYWAVVLGSFIACAFLTSGAATKPEYVPFVKRQAYAPVALALVLGLIVGIGYLASSPFFRAKAYSQVLDIDTADFDDTVSAINRMSDFDKVPLIDAAAAEALATKTLGDFSKLNLESQFVVLTEDSTQINYKGTPYRVYPLKYGNIFKWFTNSVIGDEHEGIPGYVRVNLNTQEAELITDYDIAYSTAEHFGEYLERVLRFRYPTYIFGEISFEIDETGKPYWVVEHIKKTIGLVGGDEVKGIILVDAETGEDTYYTAEAMKTEISWIDQAYDANLLIRQYNWLGRYAGGFWNSIIAQSGVRQTSQGYSFLAIGDDVYLYTGVTSVTSDDSILGFFFINQRTKEAYFYSTTGTTEAKAQRSAEDKVSDKKWKASFPILLNIDGEATYFMALKGDSDLVKSYAMVNVKQANVMVMPTNENMDLASCVKEYVSAMKAQTPPVVIEFNYDAQDIGVPAAPDDTDSTDNEPAEHIVTGVITDIRTAVIDGTTYYYFRLSGGDVYYVVEASLNNEAALYNVGDSVCVTVIQPITENLIGTSGVSRPQAQDDAQGSPEETAQDEQTAQEPENG